MKQNDNWLFRGTHFGKSQLPCERDWRAFLTRQKISG
jgi:hypothetical protein